jgi:hypothetical protein
MVRAFFCALALLALAPAPALAQSDITGVYRGSDGDALTVRVNDNGDVYATSGPQFTFLILDGTSYGVFATPDGGTIVTELAPLTVLVEAKLEEAGGGLDFGDAQPIEYRWVARGTETVGEWTGDKWELVDETGEPSGDDESAVVSSDARLAPLGPALGRIFLELEPMTRSPFAPPSNLREMFAKIFARGAILRLSNVFMLESVDDSEIDDSLFALPGPVVTPEAAWAAIKGAE